MPTYGDILFLSSRAGTWQRLGDLKYYTRSHSAKVFAISLGSEFYGVQQRFWVLKFALSWDLSDSCLIVELEACSDSCPAIISSSRHLYTSLSPPFVSSGLNETSSSCLSTSCPPSYGFPCSDFKKNFFSSVTTCSFLTSSHR